MIRVQRPATVPEVLLTRGMELRAQVTVSAHNGDSITFDRGVYAHADVKASLWAAQHDKCCFCESKVSHVAFGDVEHFRPKAGFRNVSGEELISPGYFWLAYEWTNLFYACEVCNRRHKGNLFPLANGGVRARTPVADLSAELPLFVDPSADDPSRHIGFRQEYAYSINGSARGGATIDALDLNRPTLVGRRRERLRMLEVLRKAARVCKEVRQEANQLLRESVDDHTEYTSAARAATRASPRTGAARTGTPARKAPKRSRLAKRSRSGA